MSFGRRHGICVVLLPFFWGFISAGAAAETDLSLSGKIDTSFDNLRAERLQVWFGELTTKPSATGSYELQVPVRPYYQIRVQGESIYPAIQTFAFTELFDANCQCLRAPEIAVVARKPDRVELFFAGDVMAGRRYSEPLKNESRLVDPSNPLPDLERLLKPMKPYMEGADIASVNLEAVLADADPTVSSTKSIVFYSPKELATALKSSGVDHVSLGNNHSYDYFEEGLNETIATIESAGLSWSGAGRDEEQALAAARLDVDGTSLSYLGYVGWKGRVDPNQVAEAGKSGAAFGSEANIAHSVAREHFLGRGPIVQYHGSSEYSDGPSAESEARMKLAIDNGAAMVASHHPHVAQGIEIYGEGLIAYSTGNFLFDQYFLETHGTFALRSWLDNGQFVRAEIIPLRILDYRPVPAMGSMREAVLDRVISLSSERSTIVSRSGGHGVVEPGGTLSSLQSGIATDQCSGSTPLLRGGDFENAVYDDAVDRSLQIEGASFSFPFSETEGSLLRLQPMESSRSFTLAPSTFLRVVPTDHIQVSGRFRSGGRARLTAAIQVRKAGVERFEALAEAALEPIEVESTLEESGWTRFSANYVFDEVGPLPFRPVLRFEIEGGIGL